MTTHPYAPASKESFSGHPLKILIVEHETNAGAGLIRDRLQLGGTESEIVGPEAGRPIPKSVKNHDGVIVLGGVPGPTDDEVAPWLPGVRTLIQECLDEQIPFLGVCLGGQMLAHVAGGVVGPVRLGPEVGVCQIDILPSAEADSVFSNLGSTVRAVQWHWLEIHQLPSSATLLAASETCPHQAFRVGGWAWGVQFHLEALSPTVAAWARGDRDDLKELGLTSAELIQEAQEADAYLQTTWGPVIDRWVTGVFQETKVRGGGRHHPA